MDYSLPKRNKGFTLIEVIITTVVIGSLAVLFLPVVMEGKGDVEVSANELERCYDATIAALPDKLEWCPNSNTEVDKETQCDYGFILVDGKCVEAEKPDIDRPHPDPVCPNGGIYPDCNEPEGELPTLPEFDKCGVNWVEINGQCEEKVQCDSITQEWIEPNSCQFKPCPDDMFGDYYPSCEAFEQCSEGESWKPDNSCETIKPDCDPVTEEYNPDTNQCVDKGLNEWITKCNELVDAGSNMNGRDYGFCAIMRENDTGVGFNSYRANARFYKTNSDCDDARTKEINNNIGVNLVAHATECRYRGK